MTLSAILQTASCITVGACQVGIDEFGAAVDRLDCGQDTFISEMVSYAPYIDAVWKTLCGTPGGIAYDHGCGVWDYEVSEPFGQWYVEQSAFREVGVLDDAAWHQKCMGKIKELVVAFFTTTDPEDQEVSLSLLARYIDMVPFNADATI